MVAANRATCYYPIFCIEDYQDDFFDLSTCTAAQADVNYSGNQRWNGCFYHRVIDLDPPPGEWEYPWELYDYYECDMRKNNLNKLRGGGPDNGGSALSDKTLQSGILLNTHSGSFLQLFGDDGAGNPLDLVMATQRYTGTASNPSGDYEITTACNSNLLGARFKLNKYAGLGCPRYCSPPEWDVCPCSASDWLNVMGTPTGSGVCGDAETTLYRRYRISQYTEGAFTACSTCTTTSTYPAWQGDFYAQGSGRCDWIFYDERKSVASRLRSLPTTSSGRSLLVNGRIFRDTTTGFWIVWWGCETSGIYAPAQHMYIKLIGRDPEGIYRRVSKDFFQNFDAGISCEQTCTDGSGPNEIEIINAR